MASEGIALFVQSPKKSKIPGNLKSPSYTHSWVQSSARIGAELRTICDAPTSLLRVDVGFWQKLSFQNFLPGTPKVSHYGGL
jgi:hypothetical protein